jgi:hypothetical protein
MLELLCRDYVWPSMHPLTVRPVRSQQTLSSLSLWLAATFTSPRAPMAIYQYGLYHLRLTASPVFWWLLTACPSKVFSFQLRALLLPRALQMESFLMCPQSVTFLSMCPPTAVIPFPGGVYDEMTSSFT